jgi:uncharacterized protein (DUF1697 family)
LGTQRYIAFLRAINVGGHTVKMADLRALFEQVGFENVATFIASGNVIFNAHTGDLRVFETQIETHLRQSLGYDVATFIRSASELAAIAAYQPFAPGQPVGEDARLYVAFLQVVLASGVQEKLLALQTANDQFHFHNRELYWFCQTRLSESPLFTGGLLEKTLGMPATVRNMTTIQKLTALYGSTE